MKKPIIVFAIMASIISCTTSTVPATEPINDSTKVSVADTTAKKAVDSTKIKIDTVKTK